MGGWTTLLHQKRTSSDNIFNSHTRLKYGTKYFNWPYKNIMISSHLTNEKHLTYFIISTHVFL